MKKKTNIKTNMKWMSVVFFIPHLVFCELDKKLGDLLNANELSSFHAPVLLKKSTSDIQSRTLVPTSWLVSNAIIIDVGTSLYYFTDTVTHQIFALKWDGTAYIDLKKYLGIYYSDYFNHFPKIRRAKQPFHTVNGDKITVQAFSKGRKIVHYIILNLVAPKDFNFPKDMEMK